MFSRFGSRVHNPPRIAALATASVLFFAAAAVRAQVSCQDFDPQCQTDGVCQADGTCKSTNLPDTTPCDDGNDCTTGDHCENGSCVGSNVTDGTECTTSSLGLCARKAVCQSVPIPGFPSYCAPRNPSDIIICTNSGNKCQPNMCDPATGQCNPSAIVCSDPCSTGQCDPSTGICVGGHEGAPCDDGNVCTGDDRCHNGKCMGIPGAIVPTATPVNGTPTPGPAECVGDCNGDGFVTVDEIITGVNIALGNLDLLECAIFDSNGDLEVTVDEILTAVNEALNGCPTAATAIASG